MLYISISHKSLLICCFFSVCAEEFNKCYVLLDLVALQSKNESMFVNVSWNMLHHMICPYYNWTMVNIHSQREQDFVGYFLHHKVQNGTRRYIYNTSDKFDYTYIGKLNTGGVKRLYIAFMLNLIKVKY